MYTVRNLQISLGVVVGNESSGGSGGGDDVGDRVYEFGLANLNTGSNDIRQYRLLPLQFIHQNYNWKCKSNVHE